MAAELHRIDATAHDVALSAEDLRRYREDGAILLRGLLPAASRDAVVDDLGRLIEGMEAEHGFAPAPGAAGQTRLQQLSDRLVALTRRAEGAQSAIYDTMSHMPSMHALAGERRLQAAVTALLSPAVRLHERLILLMSLPQETWHLAPWHQDWYYNEDPASTMTLYAPLQRTTAENGSLLLALGEHGRGALPHGEQRAGPATKWHALEPEVVRGFARVVDTVVEPGDALLFNSMVPHSARANRSDAVRFVVNLRFRDLADADYRRDHWRIGAIPHARAALARGRPSQPVAAAGR